MKGDTSQDPVPPHTRQGFALPPSPKERVFFFSKKGLLFLKTYDTIPRVPGQNIGMSPSGKAPDFDSGIRRFKSGHPSQHDPLAQLAEQLPFKQWVRGSNPRRVTTSEQAAYRLLRLFYKSQSALIPLLLLSNRDSLRWIRGWFWI